MITPIPSTIREAQALVSATTIITDNVHDSTIDNNSSHPNTASTEANGNEDDIISISSSNTSSISFTSSESAKAKRTITINENRSELLGLMQGMNDNKKAAEVSRKLKRLLFYAEPLSEKICDSADPSVSFLHQTLPFTFSRLAPKYVECVNTTFANLTSSAFHQNLMKYNTRINKLMSKSTISLQDQTILMPANSHDILTSKDARSCETSTTMATETYRPSRPTKSHLKDEFIFEQNPEMLANPRTVDVAIVPSNNSSSTSNKLNSAID